MANPEHAAKLLQGKEHWNTWRRQHPTIRPDLTSIDLRGADLRGADLREADLRGADLRGADLSFADLREANLIGTDLDSADLRFANLVGAYRDGPGATTTRRSTEPWRHEGGDQQRVRAASARSPHASALSRQRQNGTRGCQKLIIRCVLMVMMFAGLGGIVVGIVTATQPEPTVPTCGGSVMLPGDECEHDQLVNGIQTSSDVFNYDQQLAQTRREHDLWPLYLGGGALIFAFFLWLFLNPRLWFKPIQT
jgi:hypothetical protein